MRFSRTARPFALLRVLGMVALIALTLIVSSGLAARVSAAGGDIVFVARQHLATRDHIFQNDTGPAGQFGTGLPKFAPGSKLMIRRGDGSLTTLVDGANPGAATGYLVDVQSPDVSFDGNRILFAGATTIDKDAGQFGWRLYEIGVNGQGFRKLPIPDRAFTNVPNNNSEGYDYGNYDTYHWWNDLFPAYLADGRIVFASTRYPSRASYDARYDYQLYVVNADGSGLHRITTERGGLLHPTPLPDGRILFARWWLNFNQPSSMGVYSRIDNRNSDYTLPDGTLIHGNPNATYHPATGKLPGGGADIRLAPNAWHLHTVNPDGSDFQRFAFTPYAYWARADDSGGSTYTAAQPALVFDNGVMHVAFTSQLDGTMGHSTFHTGIRVARGGVEMLYANSKDAIAGLTYDKGWEHDDFGPPYALHPAGTPDGKILFSYAAGPVGGLPSNGSYNDPLTGRHFALQGSNLQYKLLTMNLDGSGKTELTTNIGTADAMDARPIVARTGWASKGDQFTATANDDPRQWNVPSDWFPVEYGWSQKNSGNIQKVTLHNPNIYANPPLSLPYINNSPPPGSIAQAEVWIDANQFTGAYCYSNWPDPCHAFKEDVQLRAVKYATVPVTARGEFTAQMPADVPAFIVLRDANGRAVSGWNRGYISIAQGNAYARPGQTVTCIGCHFGHVSGSITNSAEASAGWTNVAPYAVASASSENRPNDPAQHFDPSQVNDRRGFIPLPAGGPPDPEQNEHPNYQDVESSWMSTENKANGEWVQLTWNSQVKIKSVRLIGPPAVGGDFGGFGTGPGNVPYHITNGTLVLSSNGQQVHSANVGKVNSYEEGGTQLNFNPPLIVDKLHFTVNSTEGHWAWNAVAALSEIEVMGMDSDAIPDGPLPTNTPSPTATNTPPGSTPDPCEQSKPNAPGLISPAHKAKVKTLAVPLSWTDVECVTKYRVLLNKDAPDGEKVLKKRALSNQFVTDALTPGTRYFWRIKACNAKGCKVSETRHFKVTKNAK